MPNPNTILLSGMPCIFDDLMAIETVRPGMLLEYHNDSGTLKMGVHDSADEVAARLFAMSRAETNRGIDDAYAAGDLIRFAACPPGTRVWAIVPSGQNIAPGAKLQSNGDGKLKALNTGQFIAVAIESTGGAVTADTRLRVEIV